VAEVRTAGSRVAHLNPDHRVLLLAPTTKDASITEALLASAGIVVSVLPTFDALMSELMLGAAALLIPEEVVAGTSTARLRAYVETQPPWSDLPVLVLTRPGADSAESTQATRTLGNVTLLERPLQLSTLLSAVRTAIRARERQYQIRGHLEERERSEKALRVADQRKDEFLATLGHELRNPLAPLLTGLELLKASGIDDPRVTQTRIVMERQIHHLIRLVDDLLEVSRITRGLIEIQREPLDLGAILQSVVDTARPVMEASRHELALTVPDEPVSVSGDLVRLTQVFSNLLTNAAKYTNPGGRIQIALDQEDGRARVSVRDNGIGLAPEQLTTIFDMFTQVDRSNRRAQGGLGIGLTLVRSLVQLHGGQVEAHSAGPGMGSEFVVTLPMRAAKPSQEPAPQAIPSLPSKRVLVVDDNEDAAKTLGDLLATLGADVRVVNDGAAAIELAESFHPDTILLDIGMPHMDGYEVARRLRALPSQANTTLIALTGWGQDQDRRHSRAAGFDHHIVKPPDLLRLVRLIAVSAA
jgi:signal transduction histidine kinase/CheY-like chemotaxis protein